MNVYASPCSVGLVRAALIAVALSGATIPLNAQSPHVDPGRVYVVPFAGVVRLSDLAEVEGRMIPVGGSFEDAPDRIINLAVATEGSPVAGATLGFVASRSVELRLSGAYTSTEFDLSGVSSDGGDPTPPTGTFGGLAQLELIQLDASVLWRFAGRNRAVSPFVAVGAGAMIYDMKDPADFFNVEPLTGIRLLPETPRSNTVLGAVIGLGTDIRLGGHADLRLEVRDLVSSNGIDSADMEMSSHFFGVGAPKGVVHHFVVSAGLRISAGQAPR